MTYKFTNEQLENFYKKLEFRFKSEYEKLSETDKEKLLNNFNTLKFSKEKQYASLYFLLNNNQVVRTEQAIFLLKCLENRFKNDCKETKNLENITKTINNKILLKKSITWKDIAIFVVMTLIEYIKTEDSTYNL